MRLTLVALIVSVLLTACAAAPPPPTRFISISSQQEKLPLTCGLVGDRTICGQDIQTVEFLIASDLAPRADLFKLIYGNSEIVAQGLFSTVIKVEPKDQSSMADLFVIPRVTDVSSKSSGIMAFSDCTFTIDIGFIFCDNLRTPVFEVVAGGQARSKMGNTLVYESKAIERSNEAIITCMSNLSKKISGDEKYKFFINNLSFFSMNDKEKAENINLVLPNNYRRNDYDIMLMHYATKGGYSQLLDALIELGISPNQPEGKEELFPLHWAAIYNNGDAVSRLVFAGANINQRDKLNHLPIYYAAWNKNMKATEQLLINDTDIDIINNQRLASSAKIIESFGDYYNSLGRKDRAIVSYRTAHIHMKEAFSKYDKAFAEIKRDIQVAKVLAIFVSVMYDTAQQNLAEQQNRRWGEICALKHAVDTKTGTAGYYAYPQHSKVKQVVTVPGDNTWLRWFTVEPKGDVLPLNIPILEDQLADVKLDIFTRKNALEKLTEQTNASVREIELKLKALESIP